VLYKCHHSWEKCYKSVTTGGRSVTKCHHRLEKCYTSVTIPGDSVTELGDAYFKMVVVVLQKRH
jgi:hypothetical protein